MLAKPFAKAGSDRSFPHKKALGRIREIVLLCLTVKFIAATAVIHEAFCLNMKHKERKMRKKRRRYVRIQDDNMGHDYNVHRSYGRTVARDAVR